MARRALGDFLSLQFGLTVDMYAGTHCTVAGGARPIRYMAPEALRRSKFSEKSDVWAFGVTAWELLSGGDNPYFHMVFLTRVLILVNFSRDPQPPTPLRPRPASGRALPLVRCPWRLHAH